MRPSVGRGDRGTGLFGTVAAVTVFLVFLLFAVQLLVGLWGRSVVRAAAYDGARYVAGRRGRTDPAAEATARARIRAQLGELGDRAVVTFPVHDGDEVEVRVEAENPRFLSPAIAGPLATDHISVAVRVRVEADR